MSSHSKIFISKDVCQTSFVPAPSASSQARSIPFYQKKKKNHERKLEIQGVAAASPSCNSSLFELCAEESEAASGLSEQMWLVGEGSKLYMLLI